MNFVVLFCPFTCSSSPTQVTSTPTFILHVQTIINCGLPKLINQLIWIKCKIFLLMQIAFLPLSYSVCTRTPSLWAFTYRLHPLFHNIIYGIWVLPLVCSQEPPKGDQKKRNTRKVLRVHKWKGETWWNISLAFILRILFGAKYFGPLDNDRMGVDGKRRSRPSMLWVDVYDVLLLGRQTILFWWWWLAGWRYASAIALWLGCWWNVGKIVSNFQRVIRRRRSGHQISGSTALE